VTEVNSNWKKLNKVVLSVNSVDLSFSSFPSLSLQCSFENIAKGRCSLIVCEKKKEEVNSLHVETDQALMIVKIFYSREEMDNLIDIFFKKRSTSKKAKVNLDISNKLMINENGYLYVKDKMNIKIEAISWKIPLI
tara:strand:+ start:324 stop:731 length:408 start_codon:yes stop_codon:yes gene_type:complete